MSGGTSVMGMVIRPGLSDTDNEAIHLFEKAVEKEGTGLMSDAVEFYRKAFKLNQQVDLLYRKEVVLPKITEAKQEVGKNLAKKVDDAKVRKINVDKLLASFEHIEAVAPTGMEESDVTIKISKIGIDEEIVDLKPISPLMNLPIDIWCHILEILLEIGPDSWFNFSITCKKNAYVGFGSKSIWRKICELVYTNQVYYENQAFLENNQVSDPEVDKADLVQQLPVPMNQLQILPQYQMSWKYMLHNRPFVKFLGCYISVVNYQSEGAKHANSLSWSNPIRIITYYRYLRFYPDGSCVMALTHREPAFIVPILLKYNSEAKTGMIKQEILEGIQHTSDDLRIYHGFWTLSLANEVHVQLQEGSAPYYTFHYHFEIDNLGGIFNHAKLKWLKCYGVRRKMMENDEREGQISDLSIKKESPFKFSRVKSYTLYN